MWWILYSHSRWIFLCLPSNCADVRQSGLFPHQSYETEREEWGRGWENEWTPAERKERTAERQHYWNNHTCSCDLFYKMINPHLCVSCFMFYVSFSRAGLNLLEEKARKKMSNHSFNSLSAAQVGCSAVSSGSSTHTDNHFLLLMFFCLSMF